MMRHRRSFPPVDLGGTAFAGFRFPPEVIVLAVRWYLRFGLSYRDLEELLAERGVEVDHVTLFRWVQRFTPLLVDAARPCRHAVRVCWFVDETYVRVVGAWRYVYRAVGEEGQVIDVYVSVRRDLAAARRFFTTNSNVSSTTSITVSGSVAGQVRFVSDDGCDGRGVRTLSDGFPYSPTFLVGQP